MKASNNVWRLILLSLMALANISPTLISFWNYDGGELQRLPMSEVTITDIQSQKIQAAGREGKVLCVGPEGGGVRVTVCNADSGVAPWHSPPEWQVREVIFSDLNRDGEEELSLLVWRPFQPWPVDRFMPSGGRISSFRDDQNMSCHLILLGLAGEEIKELWAGSSMSDPISHIQAADFDGDGLQELAALEYSYDADPRKASITLWEWNGFGFSLLDRQDGGFSSLLPLPIGSGNVLIANQDL